MKKIILNAIFLQLLITSIIADDNKCGRVKIKQEISLINNGELAYHGQFPWLAPLLHNTKGYLCGSSIITELHLLTAAHCVLSQDEVKNYYTLLGRFDLSNKSEDHWQRRNITTAYIHEDYNATAELQRSEGDIAIFRVAQQIVFSQYIQPICLPEPSTNAVDFNGITAGFGKTEIYGSYQNTPSYATLKTISKWDCQKIDIVYSKIVAANTFCAGSESSTPCQGDSGSGFYIHDQSADQQSILGIVSFAIGRCNPKDFVVFVDVSKYIPWIQEKMGNDNGVKGSLTSRATTERIATSETQNYHELFIIAIIIAIVVILILICRCMCRRKRSNVTTNNNIAIKKSSGNNVNVTSRML